MNALQYIGLGIAIGAIIMLLVVWLVVGYNEKKNREFGDRLVQPGRGLDERE